MITKQHSHYLKFLAKGHNALVISNKHFKQFDDVQKLFKLFIQRVLNDDELDNLSNTIMQNEIKVIILDFTQDINLAKKIYKTISNYNERIVVIGIIDKKSISDIAELINQLDSLLFNPFTKEELKDKLFINLSIFYAIKAVGVRDMKITTGSSKTSDELDKFFDIYEGQLLFIVDELIELNESLKAGELSSEILLKVANKMQILAEIFSKEKKTSDIVDVFEDFVNYLKTLDLSNIEPSSLQAFDYLCALIDDINTYMMEMFVDRVFKDVYIFQHSFENNLKFMKDAMLLNDEDDSELEFF